MSGSCSVRRVGGLQGGYQRGSQRAEAPWRDSGDEPVV
jgi:hypothetical protein